MPSSTFSAAIGAPASEVWADIRDFNALPSWFPGVATSVIEGGLPSDQVGCVRDFTLDDGTRIRERLLALSDIEHSFTYRIELSPFAIEDYVARLRLLPIVDGDRCYAEWSATFDCASELAADYVAQFTGVFAAGLGALQDRFGV